MINEILKVLIKGCQHSGVISDMPLIVEGKIAALNWGDLIDAMGKMIYHVLMNAGIVPIREAIMINKIRNDMIKAIGKLGTTKRLIGHTSAPDINMLGHSIEI